MFLNSEAKLPYHPLAMQEAPYLDPVDIMAPIRNRTALLINPFYPKDPYSSYGKHVLTSALALTSIAAATPDNWEVSYWDENLLQGAAPSNPFPQVVGMTVHLTFAQRAYELAKWYRQRGAIVVMGGLHVSSCPEEVAQHADVIVIGEGVQAWAQVLQDVEDDNLQARYVGTYASPYKDDPPPRKSILDTESFLTTNSIVATRGCSNRCDFCYLSTDGLRMPYRMRRVEDVIAEISANPNPYAVFIDNNLGAKPDYLLALCQALRPLQKIWSAAVTIDVTDDPALVREMALAGCTGVFIGFETLTRSNLDDAHKNCLDPSEYEQRINLFHRNGIQVNGSFVLGFDHDGPDVFENLVDWIEQVRLECATFHILTPYPGTPLFKQMESEARILHRDWNLYDTSNVVFQPKGMTAQELLDGYHYCYRRLFSHRSIWRRRPKATRAMVSYLAMCYMYKRTNFLWPQLIKYRMTKTVWAPLMEIARYSNLRQRKRLLKSPTPYAIANKLPVSASV